MMISRKEKVQAGVCMGNIILYLAQEYGTVRKVVQELTQNMIDAKATRGVVLIDVRNMKLTSYDNGKGASKKEMKLRIQQIGARMKGEEDIGYKGTGNLAPLGIMGPGGSYEMMTRPIRKSRFTDPFFRTTVDYDDLRDSSDVSFTMEDMRPSFTFTGYKAPIDVSGMTTRVVCTNIQKSATDGFRRSKNALENLTAEIGSTFAAKIKQNDIKITVCLLPQKGKLETIDVDIQEFPGRAEEPIVIETPSGPVRFEMFTTNVEVQRPKPQIMVRHKNKIDFRLRNMTDVWDEYKHTFESGHIQGVIHLDFCEMNVPRTGFLWSDEMADFIEALDQFHAKFASGWLKTLKKKRSIHRYYEVIHQVMFSVDEFIKNNPDLIGDDLAGSVSKGHVRRRGRDIGTFVSPRQETDELPMAEVPRLTTRPPKAEIKTKVHTASRHDEKGTKRKLIRGQSGVTVDLVEPDPLTDGINWRRRMVGGIIQINMNHKDFKVASDKGNKTLGLYVAMLIVGTLTESRLDGATRGTFTDAYENYALQYLDIMASVK